MEPPVWRLSADSKMHCLGAFALYHVCFNELLLECVIFARVDAGARSIRPADGAAHITILRWRRRMFEDTCILHASTVGKKYMPDTAGPI